MNNPFKTIDFRLNLIEELLFDIKSQIANPKETEQSEKLLTVQEAAEFLSLKVPTIYSKTSKGELPFMKRGKRLYFSSTDLLEYLKEGRKKSHAEIEQEAEAYFANNKNALK